MSASRVWESFGNLDELANAKSFAKAVGSVELGPEEREIFTTPESRLYFQMSQKAMLTLIQSKGTPKRPVVDKPPREVPFHRRYSYSKPRKSEPASPKIKDLDETTADLMQMVQQEISEMSVGLGPKFLSPTKMYSDIDDPSYKSIKTSISKQLDRDIPYPN